MQRGKFEFAGFQFIWNKWQMRLLELRAYAEFEKKGTQFSSDEPTHAQHSRACAVLLVSFTTPQTAHDRESGRKYKGQLNIYILLSTVQIISSEYKPRPSMKCQLTLSFLHLSMNLQEQEKDELKDETLLHSKPQVCEPRKTVCIYHEMYFLFAEIP